MLQPPLKHAVHNIAGNVETMFPVLVARNDVACSHLYSKNVVRNIAGNVASFFQSSMYLMLQHVAASTETRRAEYCMQCYAFFSGLNTSNLYAIVKLF